MKTRKMKKIKGKAVLALIGALVSALAYAAGDGPANDLDEKGMHNPPDEYVAHVEAVQQVDLLPQVDGFIKEIKFKEGDVVKAGDVLYVLDDERYGAVANLRKADLETAEAEARRAERYWARMQKADPRGITQKERDDAEADAERAKAAVFQARANLIVAEYDLKKTKVIAPISGQIGKAKAHVGDYVGPNKEPLARIVQFDPIRIAFPLTDRAYLRWRAALKKGRACDYRMRLILPDGSEYGEQGTWDFDNNEVDREADTITMRVSFPNPDRMLVPNSRVRLLVEPRLSELGVRRSELKEVKEKAKLPIFRPPLRKAPDPKYGKGTASEDPLKNVDPKKMLEQGYRYGTRNQLATSEEQLCVSLIAMAIRREWDKESFKWYSGLRPIEVNLQLGPGGKVSGFSILSGSGDADVDRTAISALNRLKSQKIPGLTAQFIEQFPQLTIVMEPTQGR